MRSGSSLPIGSTEISSEFHPMAAISHCVALPRWPKGSAAKVLVLRRVLEGGVKDYCARSRLSVRRELQPHTMTLRDLVGRWSRAQPRLSTITTPLSLSQSSSECFLCDSVWWSSIFSVRLSLSENDCLAQSNFAAADDGAAVHSARELLSVGNMAHAYIRTCTARIRRLY